MYISLIAEVVISKLLRKGGFIAQHQKYGRGLVKTETISSIITN